MNTTQKYTVIAVSKNTNAFGLKSLILLSPSGSGKQVLRSAYSGPELPHEGDEVTLEQLQVGESPTYTLPSIDAKTAAKIIRTVRNKALAQTA
jgi:hypothetical protein